MRQTLQEICGPSKRGKAYLSSMFLLSHHQPRVARAWRHDGLQDSSEPPECHTVLLYVLSTISTHKSEDRKH